MTKKEVKKILRTGGKVVSLNYVINLKPQKERDTWGLHEAEALDYRGEGMGYRRKTLSTKSVKGLLCSLPRQETRVCVEKKMAFKDYGVSKFYGHCAACGDPDHCHGITSHLVTDEGGNFYIAEDQDCADDAGRMFWTKGTEYKPFRTKEEALAYMGV